MFAKLTDSQGRLVTVVDWRTERTQDGQMLDRFADRSGNIYFERPRDEVINGIELMRLLRAGADRFYPNQVFEIAIGR